MESQRLRVILNDRPIRRAWTGVAHYIIQLVAALAEQEPDIDLLPFYQTYVARSSGASSPLPAEPSSSRRRSNGRWPGWLRLMAQDVYNVALQTVGLVRGYQVYHEPNHIPAPWPGPIVTTIHDLSVLRYPQWHPADRVRWYERDFFAGLPRTHHFITVSEFSKREMVDLLGLDPQRITAIRLGTRSIFHPRPAEEVSGWLSQHHLPSDYLLYVGTIEPRKNVHGLLGAYAGLPSATRRRTSLVIAGMSGWGRETVAGLTRSHGLDEQVRTLGYVSEEALAYLYCGTRALVWPTWYEGFGLPPLECMSSGRPVISSNCSAMPEVVGDGGILVDPYDVVQFREAIARVLDDGELAESLAARGLERSRQFSWLRCAAEHGAIYRRVAEAQG